MALAEGIIFAILGAVVFGLWTVFHQKAAPHIDQLFGAIIVSLTAVILGAILLLPKLKSTILFTNSKGILFAVLAGVMALFIDYFALMAYSKGVPISIGGPIIIGGSICLATVIGFFLGESITLLKVLALVLVIAGSAMLASIA
jgi:transporter family protein